MNSLCVVALRLVLPLLLVWGAAAQIRIPLQSLPVEPVDGVRVQHLMEGEIPEVEVDLISVGARAVHREEAHPDKAVVWLVLDGRGVLHAGEQPFPVEAETIARAPQGWPWRLESAPGTTLQVLRVRRALHAGDREELLRLAEFQKAPYVKRFVDCVPYGEAIKSPKTVSRTLLPETYVPRMAMGTVETTGVDEVKPHRHPMLEQLFLGLKGNDITVTADDAKATLGSFAILHIPLGSYHGAQVAAGKRMHYVWMDFFATKEGQEWLKTHKPLTTPRP